MEDVQKQITWYEITKDIIIPFLGVISTIIIGVLIASVFRKRDEKIKTKQILIDTYMEYLNARSKNVAYEILVRTYEIYNDMQMNYGKYFNEHANTHHAKKLINEAIDDHITKIDSFDTNINWSFYTYKFSFLLGGKTYKKELQELETRIMNEFYSQKSITDFLIEAKKDIVGNPMIVENMNALDLTKINYALDMIESHISFKYNNFQFRLFNTYDKKLADLVNEY
ncbi:MAG: hypothetical protein EOP00_30895 [Pedobacter sp.]|nr:MAG: hypothetical protein EOP00_30895 [Pedobacter sp.]